MTHPDTQTDKERAEELVRIKRLLPTCEKHAPTGGGARAGCLLCAVEGLQSALSRIDYACESPNEMEVSQYDIDYDEERVVKRVQALSTRLAALKEQLRNARSAVIAKDKEMIARLADLLCTVPTGAPFQSVLKRAEAAESALAAERAKNKEFRDFIIHLGTLFEAESKFNLKYPEGSKQKGERFKRLADQCYGVGDLSPRKEQG